MERLGRIAPDVVLLWQYWRDVTIAAAGDVFALPEFATDYSTAGELKPENGLVDEGDEPANPGFSVTERDLEIRPTVDELQRAWESAPARQVSVHCVVRGGKRFDVQPVIDPVVTMKGAMAYIGPLAFRNGEMVRWGTFGRGWSGAGGTPPRAQGQPAEAAVARSAPPRADRRADREGCGLPRGCVPFDGQEWCAIRVLCRSCSGSKVRLGFQGKHAERRDIFLINEAFAALRALVGENILPKAA